MFGTPVSVPIFARKSKESKRLPRDLPAASESCGRGRAGGMQSRGPFRQCGIFSFWPPFSGSLRNEPQVTSTQHAWGRAGTR